MGPELPSTHSPPLMISASLSPGTSTFISQTGWASFISLLCLLESTHTHTLMMMIVSCVSLYDRLPNCP
ncbi:unnamed protein product, partial [Candidula unifasciata]